MGDKLRKATTKADLKQFKETFIHWQHVFGCQEYEMYFDVEDINTCAELEVNTDGLTACVRFPQTVPAGHEKDEHWIVETGKHEAIHLLLAQLRAEACQRFTTYDVVAREEERIVRVLEKLL